MLPHQVSPLLKGKELNTGKQGQDDSFIASTSALAEQTVLSLLHAAQHAAKPQLRLLKCLEAPLIECSLRPHSTLTLCTVHACESTPPNIPQFFRIRNTIPPTSFAERALAKKWELAMALTLLATAYCRAGRMLPRAEALLREATRLMPFAKYHKGGLNIVEGCHVSFAVRIAWQHAQLLAVLPKRDSEALQWAGLARTLWNNEHSNRTRETSALDLDRNDMKLQDEDTEMIDEGSESDHLVKNCFKLEQAMGDLGAFAGKGHPGTRNVMSFWLGRVFYS
jgi:hypothetical protein